VSIAVLCHTCRTRLTLDDDRAGTTVECPHCDASIGVPFATETRGRARDERDEPRESRRRRDDDDDDRPRSRSRRYDDDDDDRPRRGRRRRGYDDYDGYDDRPRRRYRGERKSRVAYILLGVFLGGWGVHNFYANRTNVGVAQLVICLVSIPLMFVFIGFITIMIPGIWALVDICTVDRDGDGIRMV
jgi:TM2 domain-containing membrane protein YozV